MNPLHVRSAQAQAGPSIPWIEPPDKAFTGHAWSKLVASGVKFEQVGRKVTVEIPLADRDNREAIIDNLKQLGFNGLREGGLIKDVANNNLLVVTVIVDPV